MLVRLTIVTDGGRKGPKATEGVRSSTENTMYRPIVFLVYELKAHVTMSECGRSATSKRHARRHHFRRPVYRHSLNG